MEYKQIEEFLGVPGRQKTHKEVHLWHMEKAHRKVVKKKRQASQFVGQVVMSMYVQVTLYIYPTLPQQAGCNTRSFF